MREGHSDVAGPRTGKTTPALSPDSEKALLHAFCLRGSAMVVSILVRFADAVRGPEVLVIVGATEFNGVLVLDEPFLPNTVDLLAA